MERMADLFYMISKDCGNGSKWFMLRVRKTHFCVSCGSDKEKVLSALTKGVVKHKNTSKMVSYLDRLSRKEKMGKKTFDYYEDLYWNGNKEEHEDEVEETIEAALLIVQKNNRSDNKVLNTKKKVGKFKPIKIEEEIHIEELEEKPVESVKGKNKSLIKPKLLRR